MASFPKCGWRIPAAFYISMKEISDSFEWSDFSASVSDWAEWFDMDVAWSRKSVKSGPFLLTFLLQCLIKLSDWRGCDLKWKVNEKMAPFHWLFSFDVWLSWVIWRGCDLKWKISENLPLFTDFSASVFDWAEWFDVDVIWSGKSVKSGPFSLTFLLQCLIELSDWWERGLKLKDD